MIRPHDVRSPSRAPRNPLAFCVMTASLLWVGPPAVAQVCPPLTVAPPDGQYPGGTIEIAVHADELAGVTVTFSLGGEIIGMYEPSFFNDFVFDGIGPYTFTATVPNLPPGVHTLAYDFEVDLSSFDLGVQVTPCEVAYEVLFDWISLVTVPTYGTITFPSTTTTTTTVPPPTTAPPPTAAPPPATAAEAETTATTATTVATATTAAADTTLAAAQPSDGDGLDGVIVGMLIGLGAAAALALAWALGRRQRATPTSHQPPPPPPPRQGGQP